jgi:LuxR family glucitol operon transcriptional activator
MIQINIFDFIPKEIRQQAQDTLVDFLSEQVKKHVSQGAAERIKQLRSDGEFRRQFDQGLEKAIKRFSEEYYEKDEDLVEAIIREKELFRNPEVKQALMTMLRSPGSYLEDEAEIVAQSFVSVLPGRKNRERVNQAMMHLLRCLVEELWHLPVLQPVYSLQFQKMTAESMKQHVELQKAHLRELIHVNEGVKQALLQLADVVGQRKLLPGAEQASKETVRIYHNLPNPEYGEFVGREAELQKIHEILKPYPFSQHALVTIDGIGGIGKSSLALEAAHYYLRNCEQLAPEERFGAIIWASAKRTILTTEGIKTRHQSFNRLQEIYSLIAAALQREDITRARTEEQAEIVRLALTRQRTLLVIDNLETVDDEAVLMFLRELPAPTKAIVTTRHRIDVAYPVRLTGMGLEDAQALIELECAKKGVTLTKDESHKLFDRTGGVPLAIVWCIGQMGYGYDAESVLSRLSVPSSDIAAFCFTGSMELVRGKPSHKLLMALSMFVTDGSRDALSFITKLPMLDLDDGLVTLEKLSLINKRDNRFSFLPLTKLFAEGELIANPEFEKMARRNWIDYYKTTFEYSEDEIIWRYKGPDFYKEGDNLRDAIEWVYLNGTADDVFVLTLLSSDYFDDAGRWNEMLDYCLRALNLAKTTQDHRTIGRFGNKISWQLEQQGEYDKALDSSLEALEHYQFINDEKGTGKTLQRLSAINRKRGNLDVARSLCDQAYEIAKKINDTNLNLLILHEYGKIARAAKDWSEAKKYFSLVQKQFEKIAIETPHDEQLSWGVYGHLAISEYHLGNPEKAKELCLRSLEFFEKFGTRGYLGVLKYRLALAEEALGEYDLALGHAREALDWFDRLGMRPDYAEALPLLQRLEQT